MFLEYIYFYKYFFFCLIIVWLLFFLSLLIVYQNVEIEKITAYECGFNPFSDSRIKFEIRFYIVSILFIVFDVEIVFLFPWIIAIFERRECFYVINVAAFLIMLILIFLYEIHVGALIWE